MTDTPVVIIGGGFGGLVTALSLHRLGIECVVVEALAAGTSLTDNDYSIER